MHEYNWGSLTPDVVSDIVNFDSTDKNWKYDSNNTISMAAKQAEGVAHLWNTLSLHDVAILADEVGMGKTFQALGVASLLWKQNPDAKILVMAPNRDICRHWIREYKEFLNSHYREVDHLVRNGADGGPVNAAHACWNLKTLVQKLESGSGNFFFTTIYALSGLVPNTEKSGNLNEKASKAASLIHEKIKTLTNGDGFDLIIVDEAHYFRNAKGSSQRAHAAKALFGGEASPLGKKNLLMTATPSHSGLKDVANILSYFTNTIGGEGKKELQLLLKKYALRRLRLMKGKGEGAYHNKHHYRHEEAAEANFKNNPESELFFALYQKKLVQELGEAKNGKRFLYGYLEGFESVGIEGSGAVSTVENNDEERSSNEFRKAPDTEILKDLTEKYSKIFKKFPEHPKYSSLVKELVPSGMYENIDLEEAKHLVFVRRIPSVRELTQRVNFAYDQEMIPKILDAWGLKPTRKEAKAWADQSWDRAGFVRLVGKINQKVDSGNEFNLDDGDNNDEDYSHLGSRVSELFVVKSGKEGSTDCSNVSLRFRKPESLFSMFMEPAKDYKAAGYRGYYKRDDKRWKRDFYSSAAKSIRLSEFNEVTKITEGSNDLESSLTDYIQELPTAWSLAYPFLSCEQKLIIDDWLIRDLGIVENFSNYLKTGLLFSSPVIVEIYCWFTKFDQKDNAGNIQQKYLNFIEFVKPKIERSMLLAYFKSAIDTFEPLCTKITGHDLNDWKKDWRTLAGLNNPAWYASGETSNRQRLILGFNSPFYPNVLMATSVFQEGVNLHLQCNKVHHYGIAWTPGDNEQRVGRVDRLFGKVNRKLMSEGEGHLSIRYPYLKSSFDENQVGSFIKNKHSVESKMDFCIQGDFNPEIDIKENNSNWKEYLRSPVDSNKIIDDPYPAKLDLSDMPKKKYVAAKAFKENGIKDHLHSIFSSMFGKQRFFEINENTHNSNALFLIDPLIQYENINRHQPILVEKHFSSEFSALVKGTVYYISLKTPIASEATLKEGVSTLEQAFEYYQQYQQDYPLVQMAINKDFSESHFYCHMKVDLPVFVSDTQLTMLSAHEIELAFTQLKDFSDALECEIFPDFSRDLKKEDLKIFKSTKPIDKDVKLNQGSHCTIDLGERWSNVQSPAGADRQTAVLKKSFNGPGFINLFATKTKSGCLGALDCLLLNSRYPFIRFSQVKDDIEATLAYPAVDFQHEEQVLLERWFDYCCKELNNK